MNGQSTLGICLGSNAERMENHGLESGQVEEDSGMERKDAGGEKSTLDLL